MNKDLIKAVLASILVLIIWDWLGFFGKPPINKRIPSSSENISEFSSEQKKTEQIPSASDDQNKMDESADKEEIKEENILAAPEKGEEKTLFLNTKAIDVAVSNIGGKISSVFFKKYNEKISFSPDFSPFTILRLGNIIGLKDMSFSVVPSSDTDTINLKSTINNKLEIISSISVSDKDYLIKNRISIKNLTGEDQFFTDGIEVACGNLSMQSNKPYPSLNYTRYTVENKAENIDYKKVKGRDTIDEIYYWAAVQNTTYCSILGESEFLRKVTWFRENEKETISASVTTNEFTVSKGQEKVFNFNYYIGPKLYFHLKDLKLSFENVIDYGSILGFITKPLVLFLNFLFKLTGNYGIAIILMTIIFKIVTHPLNHKSIVSMKSMQKLQPHIKQLQAQYKNDQAQLQKEMMGLYKKHGVNPLSGCFPILVQMPIFIAFYKALANSVELEGAAFLLIKDLAAPDRLITIQSLSINVLPLIMGLVQFVSSKQTTTDPTQKSLIYIFPVMMMFIFYTMPSALNLYFLLSTLIGIFQNWLISASEKAKVKE